jgi:methylmalonyl-CoA mutase C-terminal domain/subunit
MGREKIKVLIAKPGLDGHDRGARVVARSLRDAGMEVVYTGIRQTPEAIVRTALQEDVDVVGLSILSGAHLEVCPRIMRGLEENGLGQAVVIAGGIIPEEDIAELKRLGIREVFGPGTPLGRIAEFIKEAVSTGD